MTGRSQQIAPGGVDNSRQLAERLNQVIKGRLDCHGEVTLTAGAATTQVVNELISEESTPILTPMTSAAATELGAGTMYVSAVANGSFTITHANSGVTTRTFTYAFLG